MRRRQPTHQERFHTRQELLNQGPQFGANYTIYKRGTNDQLYVRLYYLLNDRQINAIEPANQQYCNELLTQIVDKDKELLARTMQEGDALLFDALIEVAKRANKLSKSNDGLKKLMEYNFPFLGIFKSSRPYEKFFNALAITVRNDDEGNCLLVQSAAELPFEMQGEDREEMIEGFREFIKLTLPSVTHTVMKETLAEIAKNLLGIEDEKAQPQIVTVQPAATDTLTSSRNNLVNPDDPNTTHQQILQNYRLPTLKERWDGYKLPKPYERFHNAGDDHMIFAQLHQDLEKMGQLEDQENYRYSHLLLNDIIKSDNINKEKRISDKSYFLRATARGDFSLFDLFIDLTKRDKKHSKNNDGLKKLMGYDFPKLGVIKSTRPFAKFFESLEISTKHDRNDDNYILVQKAADLVSEMQGDDQKALINEFKEFINSTFEHARPNMKAALLQIGRNLGLQLNEEVVRPENAGAAPLATAGASAVLSEVATAQTHDKQIASALYPSLEGLEEPGDEHREKAATSISLMRETERARRTVVIPPEEFFPSDNPQEEIQLVDLSSPPTTAAAQDYRIPNELQDLDFSKRHIPLKNMVSADQLFEKELEKLPKPPAKKPSPATKPIAASSSQGTSNEGAVPSQ